MIIKIPLDIIAYERKIQDLCMHPYYKHPAGCPNYGVKEGCPPDQPLINKVIDFERDLFLIYTEYDIGAHAQRMWQRHPEWSERQAYNITVFYGNLKQESFKELKKQRQSRRIC